MFGRNFLNEPTIETSVAELKKLLHQAVLDEFENEPERLFSTNLNSTLNSLCVDIPEIESGLLSEYQKTHLIQSVCDEVQGLGPIAELMIDNDVSDILINDFDEIWVEKKGSLVRSSSRFDDPVHLRRFVDRLLENCGRQASTIKPIVDGKLPDGSRLHVVVPPACTQAALVSIRKFSHKEVDERYLTESGYVDAAVMNFLKTAVTAGVNMVICGNAGAGKTTLLNVLANSISAHERVITIEENIELQLHHEHVVQLETHMANSEGQGGLSLRDLVKAALRMRADRIIVGEVRGIEVVDMLQAMSCGHQGSITTLHANSGVDALTRLGTLVQLNNQQLTDAHVNTLIGSSVQLIVHVTRDVNGRRQLRSVGEIVPIGQRYSYQTIFSSDGAASMDSFNAQTSPTFNFVTQQGFSLKDFIHFLEVEGECYG